MCVRNVFVLVLLLCVNSQPQRDAHSLRGYQNVSENSSMAPHLEPSSGLSDTTGPPNIDLEESQLVAYEPHIQERPVKYAGIPQNLTVTFLSLQDSDNELQFNVSWRPSLGRAAKEYSVEILSEKNTDYCESLLCYIHPIPGNATWVLIPESVSQIVGKDCVLRPGCSYTVILNAHPWDGITNLTRRLDLEDCVVGVCSCAHSKALPTPNVTTNIVMNKEGDMFTNVIWTLPKPSEPQQPLPAKLRKQIYVVSLNKQVVALNKIDSAPWFTVIYKRTVEIDGLVSEGDTTRSLLLPLSKRDTSDTPKPPSAKILARVQLVDDRGCIGPQGNATAFEPEKPTKSNLAFGVYAIIGALLGAWAMGAVFVVSARIAKRVLKSLRPAPVSAPLEPLRRRPAWFPLQLRTNNEIPVRGQMEESPLYTQKEFEVEEGGDEWEVSRSRVHLGSLIGSGAFGRVHAAQLDMPGGETITVAAKMLTENVTDEEIQDFLREIVMLKHVGSHKHVIRLVACCTRRAPYIALLEHAPRGDLLSLLRAARGRRKERQDSNVTSRVSSQGRPSEAESEYTNLSDSDPALSDGDAKLYSDCYKKTDHYVAEPALQLDGSTMREYALQVALGMRHLEERGITHRDLAARNILVDGAGLLKVADFGLSRSGVYIHTRSRPVPLRWLAPEAILHSHYCGASDVWAFAVLLWEIATLGGFPYAELSNHHVPQFLAGGGRLPKPARASPRLYQLMVECWSENPTNRPTFSEIVDKLTVQKQLYVDLDCVFPPSEDDLQGLRDFDFNMAEANGQLDR